ncbi:hypothetical protein K443DRAFT_332868 [Laccaria amethystina LaAM-08-1]|uniref:Uncharacterized protein n=1 Tax=Laccaria amethystina LaAM-08-1 TaxID=1095629 RepID=A0A0C9XGI3_9AGAR|nr:hypothetical protein K443DRAFT_332868 [Laccaria amethystina LaAM-08-1]
MCTRKIWKYICGCTKKEEDVQCAKQECTGTKNEELKASDTCISHKGEPPQITRAKRFYGKEEYDSL